MGRDLGDVVEGELNISQQCALAAKPAVRTLGCTRRSTAPWGKGLIVPLHPALVQPPLVCVLFWGPLYKYIKILVCVQKRSRKMEKGLEGVI